MNKIVVYLSTLFPAKTVHPTITCRPAKIPTLGSSISATPTTEPDYRSCFKDWGW